MTEGEQPRWVPPGTGQSAEQDTQRFPPGYGGSPWGPPPYPAGQPRTEGLAVAALVLAIVSFPVPVVPAIAALVLAAMAARRIREAPEGSLGGRGLVTAARAVAVIGLVVWVGLAALAVDVVTQQKDDRTGGPTALDSGLPSEREVGVDALEVGDCVKDDTLRDEGQVETVDAVSCGQPHDLEVYVNVTVPGDAFPGDQALEKFGNRSCIAHFKNYVGIPLRDSEFDYFYYAPSEDSWNGGDRVVTCGVIDPDFEKLTSSARGARR
jgi:hypothetical protein